MKHSKNSYPVDDVISPINRALSVIKMLSVAVEHSEDFQIQAETAQNVLWVVERELQAAVKASDAWEGASK